MTAPAAHLIPLEPTLPTVPSPPDSSPQNGPEVRKATILDRSAILGANDRQMELVDVPEWGGAVYVRAMSGSDRDSLEGETLSQSGKEFSVRYQDLRAKLTVRSIVDETGKRIFADTDWQEMAGKSAAALDRVFTVGIRLSRMRQQDLDTLVGESVAVRPSASPTA